MNNFYLCPHCQGPCDRSRKYPDQQIFECITCSAAYGVENNGSLRWIDYYCKIKENQYFLEISTNEFKRTRLFFCSNPPTGTRCLWEIKEVLSGITPTNIEHKVRTILTFL
jgi:hypothetical protein